MSGARTAVAFYSFSGTSGFCRNPSSAAAPFPAIIPTIIITSVESKFQSLSQISLDLPYPTKPKLEIKRG